MISLSSETCLQGTETTIQLCVRYSVFSETKILQITIVNEMSYKQQYSAWYCTCVRQVEFIQNVLALTGGFLTESERPKRKIKKKKDKNSLQFPSFPASFAIWTPKFFHQVGRKSDFSKYEVHIVMHTHTELHSIASVNFSCASWRRLGTVILQAAEK